eukprot:5732227-Pleurochrysis_carterae.AAC.1
MLLRGGGRVERTAGNRGVLPGMITCVSGAHYPRQKLRALSKKSSTLRCTRAWLSAEARLYPACTS